MSSTAVSSTSFPTGEKSPGIDSSGGGTCPNRSGIVENVGYMNDVAISYGSPHTGGVVSASMIYPSGIADEIGVGDIHYSYGLKCIITLRELIGKI